MSVDPSRSQSVISIPDNAHNGDNDDNHNHNADHDQDVTTILSPPPLTVDPTRVEPSSSKPPSVSLKPMSTKPKSAKAKARTPSPSPPPPPAPQPLRTIRLDIKLGGPENYEVDISSLCKATGQRAPTPVPAKPDTSDSDSEDDKVKDGPKPRKRKKKNAAAEYYDVNDPFIDDSELAIDQRTFFAQTKQQGFYVSSGEVALLKDKSPRKPKSKKLVLPLALDTPGSSRVSAKKAGTRDSPIPLSSDGENQGHRSPLSTFKKDSEDPPPSPLTIGKSNSEHPDNPHTHYEQPTERKKQYITVLDNGKKKKIPDITSFHPELQASIQALKEAIARESWEVKGKFPPSIKPLLATIAMQAIRLGEYDEHFFNLMPAIFPYNKFTMSKLIKRTVFPEHTKMLINRQDELLRELKEIADAGFDKAQEEWEKNVLLWDKRQEKSKLEAGGSASASVELPVETSRQVTEEDGTPDAMDVDGPQLQAQDGSASASGASKESHPPSKRFRLTEPMKIIIWQLVLLSNEVCRLENEKNNLEGSAIQISEQGLRKVLYQKIVGAYPAGWMSSGQISREVSAMKKRFEREALENE